MDTSNGLSSRQMPFGMDIVNIPAHYVWSLDYICCYKHGTRSNLQSYMRKISRVHYLDSKCESWKFPDRESIKLLDLPYLHVGFIPFKIFPFGTSCIAVSNTATPISRCLSPPLAIQLEFLPYRRIFVYLTGFSSVWKRTPYIGILSPFWPDLVSQCTPQICSVSRVIQQMWHKL